MRLEDRTDEEFAVSKERCVLCESKAEAIDMLKQIDEAALDFETTGLSPRDGGVIRLTSICNDDFHLLIDHEFLGHFTEFYPFMRGKKWWVYNAKFEQRWLDYYDPDEGTTVLDVDFAKKAKIGGAPSSLAKMARDLGVDMDKGEQGSDWARVELTEAQYDYAGFDSHVTWELKKKWWDEELEDHHRRGFYVFNDAVRATMECEETGLHLNHYSHQNTVKLWQKRRAVFERYVRKYTPEKVIPNVNSNKQLSDFFERELHPDLLSVWPRTPAGKQLQVENSYLRSVARKLPYPMSRWMAALVGYRYYGKYLSTYGDTLLNKQALEGKITSRFNIGQAHTGRYSSSNSNLQNIPRKPVVRSAFCVPDPGESKMVLADYSGIEIRVLAELSGDEQLLEDAIHGDVHAASAAQIYKEDYDTVREVLDKNSDSFDPRLFIIWKERRTKAKGFSFQLTYGAGAGALSDVLGCSFEGAVEAIQLWATRYPKAYNYRNKMFDEMMQTGFLPVCDGRTIYVRKDDRTMPVAANYPIQGAAASVMYRAMYRVRERMVDKGIPCWLAATVHDELLAYADTEAAEDAMMQMITGMSEGWLDVFPGTSTENLIDWAIGDNWSAKP